LPIIDAAQKQIKKNSKKNHLLTCMTAAEKSIIIIKMKDKICLLIDVAIPSDRNVMQESEKKLKYKNLNIEIQRMWIMKCFVMPVITGATGIVTKGLKNIWKQYQESIQ
jgi:hypothetical protein